MAGKSLRVVATGLAMLAASLVEVSSASATTLIGAWQTQAPAPEVRLGAQAFATPAGIFVVGDAVDPVRARSALAYDVATDSWSSAGSPAGEHDSDLSAGQLSDGRIAVIGGGSGPGSTAADLFDPATSTWTALPPMSVKRDDAQVLGLADGRLLVAGGDAASFYAPATAEVFNPVTNTWTTSSAPPLQRGLQLAGQLPSGRVLAVGVSTDAGSGFRTGLWDPVTGVWSAAATYPLATTNAPGVTVTQGVAIGFAGSGGYYGGRDAFRYDELGNRWNRLADFQSRRSPSSAAVTLADGRLMIAGGCCPIYSPGANAGRSAEILDLQTGEWTATGRLNTLRYYPALVVAGGSAYVFGGSNVLERFDPSAAPPSFDPQVAGLANGAPPDTKSRKTVQVFAHDAASFLPLSSTPVRMVVEPGGPSTAGTSLTCTGGCTTDSDGQVVGSYANTTAAGTDTILIHIDLDNDATVDAGEPTTTVDVSWTQQLTQVTGHHPAEVWKEPLGVSAYLGWVYSTSCSGGGYGGGGCVYLKAPLAGRTINFYGRTSNTLICSGVTGADGIARCGLPVEKAKALAANGMRVEFAGDSLYAAHTAYVK